MASFFELLLCCILAGWGVYIKIRGQLLQRKLRLVFGEEFSSRRPKIKVAPKQKRRLFINSTLQSPDFLLVYGVKNIVITSLIVAGYAIFAIFCCMTFDTSPVVYVLSAGVILISAGMIVTKKYKRAFSDYFESQFPYALRLISRNLAVGQTIYLAVDAAALNLNGIMQREFKRISSQLKNGISFEEILDKGERIYPYKGYYVFSAYLKISLQKGSSLKETLMALADDLVSAQVIKKKTRALTSEARGAAKILAILPVIMVGILYSFARDNFIYMFSALYGHYIVIYVVISVSLGFVIAAKMINKVEL
ncbi:type II secretion system F family protein [Enterobacteriaceae bacterium BIT-l23]|uniref:type II secretion system F family protein n=1 Tax=Jejubacter sp. L23 TaxID=3092086 RepID=UPI001584E744|nr:type II secretion system F family protein [Enterobacteriaceae bacterium BIT-l23]